MNSGKEIVFFMRHNFTYVALLRFKKDHCYNTRESFRLRQHELPAMDFVVVAKKGVADLDNRALSEALEKLWRRHCRLARGS